jgi:3-hydroxyisobutyrate dehydrogenase
MKGQTMRVGFIGLGMMGGAMALNARAAGFEVAVHDLRKEMAAAHIKAGATWADSAEDAGRDADVVLTSLPGPREVKAVAEGLIKAMRSGTAWFDLSTNSPTVVRELHKRFAEKGVSVLDAPVSGGPGGAKSGKMALWVGGDQAVFERCRKVLDAPVSGGPGGAKSGKMALWVGGDQAVFERCRKVLDALGDQVIYIGAIGAGSVAKLVHNCAGYAMQLALAELFTMGVKAGVEPLPLWAAIRQGALGRKRSFDRMGDQFLQGKFDPPAFALALAHKDVTLATELAREIGVPMRLANMTYAEMTEALNRGWEKRDSRSFLILQQERAGLNIKVPLEEIEAVLKRDG